MTKKDNKVFRLTEILEPRDIQTILAQAVIVLAVLIVASGILYLLNREETWGNFLRNAFISLIISLLLIQLIKANQTQLAAYLTLGLLGIWLIGVAWDGAGVKGPAYTLLVLVVIGSGLFIGRQAGYITALILTLAGVGLVVAGRAGLLENLERPITDIASFLLASVTFFIAAVMIRIALDQVERALARAQKEVDERIAAEEEIRRLNTDLEHRVQERTGELVASQEKHRLRADEMSLLYKLSNSLAAGQDLYNTLLALQTEIIALFPVDAFYVAIYNPDTGIVSYPIFFYKGAPTATVSRRLMDTPGLTGAVYYRAQTLYLPDLADKAVQEKYTPVNDQNLDLHTFLGVPLISKGRVIGILSVQSIQIDAYSPEQIRLVEAITVQAALAIDKATLLDQLQYELTERKKLIGELEDKNAELERFTYTVSHDLRSPLVTIKGFLGMLQKDLSENKADKAQNDIQRISSAADKMDTLLSELLELSRVGRIVNPPEEIDLTELIHDALDTVKVRLTSKDVEVSVQPCLPQVRGDRTRLRELFENLLDNAVKYMGNQSVPTIEIGVRDDEQQVIFVRDNGIGIEPKHHESIFGLFNKLDIDSEGSGAGLAICKRIVETHGGRIWVESEGLGMGSAFCFTIPQQEE